MISIIIPCKNRLEQLCECLSSVYNAITYAKKKSKLFSEVEVLVINDHSDLGFAEKVLAKYPNCCVISSDGYGPGYARNLGIRLSRGEYLFFTDSDCLVDEQWIANGYNWFVESNAIVIQGIPWLFQKSLNPDYGQCEETLYEIMFSKYVEGSYTIMTDSRNLLLHRSIIDYVGREIFSEKTEKATAESRVFGKKCNNLGLDVMFARNVKVYHEDPKTMQDVCRQKYRHGSGRVLIWNTVQNFECLKSRYFEIPIEAGLPRDYILPAHASFLLGFYNNMGDNDEKRKFYNYLQGWFLQYEKRFSDYSELMDFLQYET